MNRLISDKINQLFAIYGSMSDEMLRLRILNGENAGDVLVYVIYGRYFELLRNQYRLIDGEGDYFFDMLAELEYYLFKGLYKELREYDGTTAFSTWISGVARRIFIKRLPGMYGKGVDAEELREYLSPRPYNELERVEIMYEAIRELDDNDCKYVMMKQIEGYTGEEVAMRLTQKHISEGIKSKLLGPTRVTPANVYKIKERAIEEVVKFMEKYPYTSNQNAVSAVDVILNYEHLLNGEGALKQKQDENTKAYAYSSIIYRLLDVYEEVKKYAESPKRKD
jgi:hypothetical protein